jgi:hypothetical protein
VAWTAVGSKTFGNGDELPAADLNTYLIDNLEALVPSDSVAITSWTPTLVADTGNSPGTSATSGGYYRIGPIVHCWARWVIQINFPYSSGGPLQTTLPVTSAVITSAAASGTAIGNWRGYRDSSTADSESGTAFLAAGATVRFGLAGGNLVTGSAPFIWDDDDVLSFSATYPVA